MTTMTINDDSRLNRIKILIYDNLLIVLTYTETVAALTLVSKLIGTIMTRWQLSYDDEAGIRPSRASVAMAPGLLTLVVSE